VLDPIQIAGAAIVLAGIIIAQTARAGKVIDADLAIDAHPAPVTKRKPSSSRR
jgi:hypothetical protein